jgi:hypothetical protein
MSANENSQDLGQANKIAVDDEHVDRKYVWSDELSDFVEALDSYASTVPEAAVQYYAQRGGLAIKDENVLKVIALATDKFLAETVHEAKQLSLLRHQANKTPAVSSRMQGAAGKRRAEAHEILEMVSICS